MNDSLRTFIAVKIEPGPGLIQLIQDLKGSLQGEAIKWVEVNNLHLTLKFIGDTSGDQIVNIKKVLKEVACLHTAFSFNLKGIGYFKSKNNPRVLFAGITDENQLQALAEEIDYRLDGLGFEREKRIFNPHLTLARIKHLNNKAAFYKLTDEFRNFHLQEVNVKDLIFYRSILSSSGPEYRRLAKINLQ